MRGYFAIGVERLSKPMNFGNLLRSAHAFGASFAFTIAAAQVFKQPGSDTAKSVNHLPLYTWETIEDMRLPHACALVGVEFIEDAQPLPGFYHPRAAAYVLGPEKGSLSAPLLARCDHVVKIPTRFCINVATAGAIVMYDRIRNLGSHPPRLRS